MSTFNKPAKALGTLVGNTADRMGKARGKFKKSGALGGYSSADLVTDLMGFWADSVQMWTDLLSPTPTVPMCFITGANGSSPFGYLTLTDAIDNQINLATLPSDLVGVKNNAGGVQVIPKANVALAFTNAAVADELKVTVNLGGLGNADKGLYQGVVADGGQILGTILVQVT